VAFYAEAPGSRRQVPAVHRRPAKPSGGFVLILVTVGGKSRHSRSLFHAEVPTASDPDIHAARLLA
jgi:hypothetical protein